MDQQTANLILMPIFTAIYVALIVSPKNFIAFVKSIKK